MTELVGTGQVNVTCVRVLLRFHDRSATASVWHVVTEKWGKELGFFFQFLLELFGIISGADATIMYRLLEVANHGMHSLSEARG